MTSAVDSTTSHPQRQHYGVAFLALAGASYAMLQSTVAPALPVIQDELGASSTATAWVFTGYLLSASILTPIVGRLGDMFGKARTLVIAGVKTLLERGDPSEAILATAEREGSDLIVMGSHGHGRSSGP